MRDAPLLFDQTKTSRRKPRLQRNIIGVPVFAPFSSSLCPLMAASSQRSALGHFAPHVSGRPSLSRE